jgi:hypothetical protein
MTNGTTLHIDDQVDVSTRSPIRFGGRPLPIKLVEHPAFRGQRPRVRAIDPASFAAPAHLVSMQHPAVHVAIGYSATATTSQCA